MSDNLKSKTEKALIWSFFDKFGQQILYFVSGVILANILMPSDYGKIGLLALFTALSNILIDSGFGSALIRKRGATETDYATVFYFNIVLSVFFYAKEHGRGVEAGKKQDMGTGFFKGRMRASYDIRPFHVRYRRHIR